MEEFILSMMNQFGYIGVFLLIAIENIFPPIPSEVILLFGGCMTTYSELNIILMIIFATLGSLIGAIVLYYIGKNSCASSFIHSIFRIYFYKIFLQSGSTFFTWCQTTINCII